jgi:hypothetical protein
MSTAESADGWVRACRLADLDEDEHPAGRQAGDYREVGVFSDHPVSSRYPRAASASSSRWK